MAEVTVSQFAEVLKVPVDRLLVQLDQAGIKVQGPDDRISDDAKLELLTHLRRSHGAESERDAAPRRITLKRKTQSELKLASGQGRARTVSVEVRQKRTYIKRDVLEEQARHQQDELDQKRREAEEVARRESERIEAERRERERLEAENRRRVEEEEVARRRAQDEARRLAEQRAHDEEERREREEQQRQAQERQTSDRRVP
ncbi:MAG: translation initiation factor IF-2 associated domain-containing protein, partial [Steroidobacteraceae bacterium]